MQTPGLGPPWEPEFNIFFTPKLNLGALVGGKLGLARILNKILFP
jgi:hypothetical protein